MRELSRTRGDPLRGGGHRHLRGQCLRPPPPGQDSQEPYSGAPGRLRGHAFPDTSPVPVSAEQRERAGSTGHHYPRRLPYLEPLPPLGLWPDALDTLSACFLAHRQPHGGCFHAGRFAKIGTDNYFV